MALLRPSMNETEKQQFEAVKQELALFQINQLKRNEEIKLIVAEEQRRTRARGDNYTELEAKVKTLEDARTRQIVLNATFAIKAESYKPTVKAQPKKKWKFW